MSMWLTTQRVAAAGCAAIIVAMAGVEGAAAQSQDKAQDKDSIFFLWGGDNEWGGKRQSVRFDPKYGNGDIIVSFGDRRLYLVTGKGQALSYPIAVPREQSRWEGRTNVSMKRENPSWVPTPDMIKENPRLPSYVPGGHPMNPLGVRALYLGSSTYRIHGTDAPWTIGQAVSKGCIRMFNEDVLDLYPRVPVGTKVTVTWQRFNTNGIASAPAPESEKPTPVASMAKSKPTKAASVAPAAASSDNDEAYEMNNGVKRTLYGRRTVGTRDRGASVQ